MAVMEADEWKRELSSLNRMRLHSTDARIGPIGRVVINKTRMQYTVLNVYEIDFFKDLKLCYDDCRWSAADSVIFAPYIPLELTDTSPDLGGELRARGYSFVHRPHVASMSRVIDGKLSMVTAPISAPLPFPIPAPAPLPIAKLLDPPPALEKRLGYDAAHFVLEGDRQVLTYNTVAFSSPLSPDGLDEDRAISSEPQLFSPTGWLYADCLLVNLTQWTFSELAAMHGNLTEELAYIRKENGWVDSDVVTLCIDHTRAAYLKRHLLRKGVTQGKSIGSYSFTFPRF